MENLKEILNKLFLYESTNWLIQLVRYVFVGGLAFVVDYGLLYIFTEYVNLHYLISASFSFIAGLVANYIMSTHWIFKKSKMSNKTIEFLIYGIIGVIGLLLNDFLMYLLTDGIHIHYLVSKIITAVVVMGWNFLGRRTILFKNY